MNICLLVFYACLNAQTNFNEIFCVCPSVSQNDLDSQFGQCIGSAREGARIGILRYEKKIFV